MYAYTVMEALYRLVVCRDGFVVLISSRVEREFSVTVRCVYVCVCIGKCVCMYKCVYVCVCVCVHACVLVSVCVCWCD